MKLYIKSDLYIRFYALSWNVFNLSNVSFYIIIHQYILYKTKHEWFQYISKTSSYWKIQLYAANSFLTLLKFGAPSVCGASFTSLSMPSKWSVIALHVEMSAMMMFYFLFKHKYKYKKIFHRILSQLFINDEVTLIANFYKYAPLV